MHDQGGFGIFPEAGDPIAETGEDVLAGRLAPPQIGRHVARLHGENHRVRLKSVERAPGIENLLRVRIELAQVHVQRDARGVRSGLEDGYDGLHRKRPQDRPSLLQKSQVAGDALIPRDYEPSQCRCWFPFPGGGEHARRFGGVALSDGAIHIRAKFPIFHHSRLSRATPL